MCKVQKKQLNVMWRANSKTWITQQFFIEWLNEVFGPSVKKYLQERASSSSNSTATALHQTLYSAAGETAVSHCVVAIT